MQTRRSLIVSGTALAALVPTAALAQRGRARYVGGDTAPTLIPGRNGQPDRADCGHGLIIPMHADAMQVLWEGDDRFVTFGSAYSTTSIVHAMGHSEFTARAMMKLALITLAFAPERLVRYERCGWRTRSGEVEELLQGDVELPGRPFHPNAEEYGNSYTEGPPGSEGAAGTDAAIFSLCVYVVLKREGGLGFVRQNALLVCPQDVPEPPLRQRNEAAMEAGRQVCTGAA